MGYLPGELSLCVESGERLDVAGGEGVCHLTNYRLVFQGAQGFEVALKSIAKLSQSQENQVIQIHCKDYRVLVLKFLAVKPAKSFFEVLRRHAFPAKLEDVFAFRQGHSEWGLNLEDEYNRCCLDGQRCLGFYESVRWHPSYPAMFIVHNDISKGELWQMAPYREGRIPAVVWAHRVTHALLVRCGQPMKDRCAEDDKLISLYRDTATNRQSIAVVDVRSPISTWGKQVRLKGGDNADYKGDVSAGDITAVRRAMEGVSGLTAINSPTYNEDHYLTLLEATGWLTLIKQLLEGSLWIAQKLEKEKTSVVLYCLDGSDRTPQFTSLAQLLLDPYYRTMRGFALLVEKEWVQFGHKFASRVGHKFGKDDDKERSPIFLEFLHAVWQLTAQFPRAFEFTEDFLLGIADHVSSCRFGTFLCDNARERAMAAVQAHTSSLWDYLLSSRTRYLNASFTPEPGLLTPRFRAKHVQIWEGFFLRFDPAFSRSVGTVEALPLLQPSSGPLQALAALPRQKSFVAAAPEALLKLFRTPWSRVREQKHAVTCTSKFFEVPLAEALKHGSGVASPDSQLPAPVGLLIAFLTTNGLDTPGLFRESVDTASVEAQVQAWKRGEVPMVTDPMVAGEVLKRFFRLLPEPLIPFQHYPGFVNVAQAEVPIEEKKIMYRNMVASIPEPNGHVLCCLLNFLASVAAQADVNRMSPQNLAVCWAPNLLRSADLTDKEVVEHAKLVVGVIATLIADPPSISQAAAPVLPTQTVDPGKLMRISVIGNIGVGKRTFINRCAQGKILVDDTQVVLEWSTECGPGLLQADLVLACFNLQYYPSFASLMAYGEELRSLKKPTVLVGLQSDGEPAPIDIAACVQEIAASSYRYCSAVTGEGVLEVVEEGVRQVLTHAKKGSSAAVQIARLFQSDTGVEINLPGADARQIRNVSFPLKDITKKWLFFAEQYLQPSSDPGPRRALHGALAALKNLAAIDNKEWQEAVPKLQVGLIKATSDCGNTSVSMGLASQFFNRLPGQHVALLNFGTGGVRFQLYTKNEAGIVSCLLEYKPPGRDQGLLAKLKVGSYAPDGSVQPAQLQKEIRDGLEKAPWNKPELQKKFKMGKVPVYAFVTGPLRNHWESHPEEAKMISNRLHEVLAEVLPADSCYSHILGQPAEYLIPQHLEGTMELVANRVMYQQYSALTGQNFVPVVSLGVGKGSSQWTSLDPDLNLAQDYHTYKLEPIMQFGMDCPELAERLGTALVANYKAGKIEDLARLVRAVCESGSVPVIALKSGCLLALDDSSSKGGQLRKALVELDYPSGPAVSVLIRRREQPVSHVSHIARLAVPLLDCELPTSLPLACAKATQLLGRPEDRVIPDFLKVELGGRFVTDLSAVPAGSTLVFWTSRDLLGRPVEPPRPAPSPEEDRPVLIHTSSFEEVKITESAVPPISQRDDPSADGKRLITFFYGETQYTARLRPGSQRLSSLIARLLTKFRGASAPSLYYAGPSEGSNERCWFKIDSDECLVYALGLVNSIVCIEEAVEMIN